MTNAQPGILAPSPKLARYLTFSLKAGAQPPSALSHLAGESFDAFEAQLKRMVGAEDGITDALFKFTTPISGSYFWCPPMISGKLDLRTLGL